MVDLHRGVCLISLIAWLWLQPAAVRVGARAAEPRQYSEAPQATGSQQPGDARIRGAIGRLGSKTFAERQEAMRFLWSLGREAEPALRQAAGSDDPEVRLRAHTVLDRFRLGVFADTPRQTVALIHRFRDGDATARRDVMRTLVERKDLKTILALAASEANDDLRSEWNAQVDETIMNTVPALLVDHRSDEAERLLVMAATSDEGMRHHVAWCLLSGRLDDEIRNRSRKANLEAADCKWLAYAYRARGDLDKAGEYAKSLPPEFQADIHSERRDWPALATLQEDLIRQRNGGLDIEALGYAAAYHRLAGDERAFAEKVRTIKSLALRNSGQAWYGAEALLVNGEVDDALRLMRQNSPAAAFELLCFQQNYREAFSLAGISYPDGLTLDWFRGVAGKVADPKPGYDIEERFRMAICAARTLKSLGRPDDAMQGLRLLAEGARNDRDGRHLRQICDAEVKLKSWDAALQHAAEALGKDPQPQALNLLFPDDILLACLWWQYLPMVKRGESVEQRLRFLWEILNPAPGNLDDRVIGEFIDTARQQFSTLKESSQQEWLEVFARTWLKRGNRREARRLYEQAAEFSWESALKAGDLWAADGQWDRAAQWYARARQMDQRKPLAAYLEGQALIRSGRIAEGNSLVATAKLLPLASSSRHDLALGMEERGYADDALPQFQLILRTGGFRQWRGYDAAKRLGNATSGSDPLSASALWESMLLSCLSTRMAFMEIEGYIQIPLVIHKTRAAGLLHAGRVPEALAEIELCRRYSLSDPSLVEELVPALEQAGHSREATELFEAVSNCLRDICEDFPSSGVHCNNLAWMSARCGRDLDSALKYAKRAVELAPGNASYRDTLAEVQFRLGNAEEAARLEEECLRLDPGNRHFLDQRARFQATANEGPRD